MPSFKDRENHEWEVRLDAPTIEDVEEKHQIVLDNLEKDPLGKLWNNPRVLVAVIYLICQEQIEKMGLTPEQFGRRMPSPPDAMIDAIREAIIDFFPTGRASHVRDVLTSYEKMHEKTDAITKAKMEGTLTDSTIDKRLRLMADMEFDKAIETMLPSTSEP